MKSREAVTGIVFSSQLSPGCVNLFASVTEGYRIVSSDSVHRFWELKLNTINPLRQPIVFLCER